MKVIAFLLAAVLFLIPALLSGQPDLERPERGIRQLIRNPGCEEILVGGNIPEWVEVVGTNWTQRASSPSPQEGAYYFFPGVCSSGELRQDVDINPYAYLVDTDLQSFEFSGYVRSYTQTPADLTNIILEYLNHDKSVVLDTYNSGAHNNTSDWLPVSDARIAPIGTRFIRIRLVSTRNNGSNNDGYYDGLSLTTFIPQPSIPQGLSITLAGGGTDIFLDWGDVTTDELGNAINVTGYRVHYSEAVDFVCGVDNLVATVSTSQAYLSNWTGSADKSFFKVIAIAPDIAP
jgi:hypothetical protein